MYNRKTYITILTISIIIALLSINNHSFWIDEGFKYLVIAQTEPSSFFSLAASEKQFFFHLLGWCWSKIAGTSEFGLRCFNIPFLLIAIFYLVRIFRTRNVNPYWVLVVAIHPFIIYYLNEYSSYVGLFACSLGILYHGYFSPHVGSRKDILLSQFFLIFGYSLHFIFGFAGFLYLALICARYIEKRDIQSIKTELLAALVYSPFYISLTWTYLYHMWHGADRGWDPPGIQNIAYVIYSFVGMQGLGLPRDVIRAGNFESITPVMITLLSAMTICISGLLCLHFKLAINCVRSRTFTCSVIAWIIFGAASYVMHFHFWERHLVWFFPAIILLIVPILISAWQTTKLPIINKGLVILTLALLVTSSVRLRTCYSYQKEDYKGVLQWIQTHVPTEMSDCVLSQGFGFMFDYYKVPYQQAPPTSNSATTNIVAVNDLNESQLVNLIHQKLNEKSVVILALWRKNTYTGDLYENAEKRIGKHFSIKETTTGTFNSFKILTLEKKTTKAN